MTACLHGRTRGRHVDLSINSGTTFWQEWQFRSRYSKHRVILTVEANRSQPLALPINRGLCHIAYPLVASHNEVLLLLRREPRLKPRPRQLLISSLLKYFQSFLNL